MTELSKGAYRLVLTPYHPVPYQVPFYRALHADSRVAETVVFLDRMGMDGYRDDFGSWVKWDVPLLDGYSYRFLNNYTLERFKNASGPGRINPGILSVLRRGRYDAVLVTGYMMVSSWLAILGAKMSGTKLLLRAEADLVKPRGRFKRWLKDRLLRLILRRCDAVMYSCSANREYFSYFGVPSDRLFPLLSSVDNAKLQLVHSGLAGERSGLRQRLHDLSEDDLIVLFVGRLSKRKRPIDLLDAFSKASRGRDNAVLLFVGDGPELETLQASAEARDCRVIFAGFRNSTEMPAYYTISDLFVLPSEYDPTPKVVNEALVFGVPSIVSTGVGTAGDLVKDGINGYVFQTGDVSQLSQYLQETLDDGEMRKQFSDNAIREVSDWTPQSNVDGVVDALEHVLPKSRSSVAGGLADGEH